MPVTKPRITGKVVRARVAAKLSPLEAEVARLKADLANVSEALAEAAWLLDRCTPPRFRDRELAPRIRAMAALAGTEAFDRVMARVQASEMPTLGMTAPSVLGTKACGAPPPEMYGETNAPCHWNEGHAGDHLWRGNTAEQFDVTGRSEP